MRPTVPLQALTASPALANGGHQSSVLELSSFATGLLSVYENTQVYTSMCSPCNSHPKTPITQNCPVHQHDRAEEESFKATSLPQRYSVVFVIREVLLCDPALLAHAPEDAARPVEEIQRAVQLHDAPRVHDTDAVVVDDRAQAMRDAEQSFAFETRGDCALDLLVGFHVYRTGCFV